MVNQVAFPIALAELAEWILPRLTDQFGDIWGEVHAAGNVSKNYLAADRLERRINHCLAVIEFAARAKENEEAA